MIHVETNLDEQKTYPTAPAKPETIPVIRRSVGAEGLVLAICIREAGCGSLGVPVVVGLM